MNKCLPDDLPPHKSHKCSSMQQLLSGRYKMLGGCAHRMQAWLWASLLPTATTVDIVNQSWWEGEWDRGVGGLGLSRPPSDTLSPTTSHAETVDGWENTCREALTRRLSYHGIRSGLWETAPPKHTCTLSVTHTYKHAGAHSGRTRTHKGVTRGNLWEDWGRQLGTRQFQTNTRLYLSASCT